MIGNAGQIEGSQSEAGQSEACHIGVHQIIKSREVMHTGHNKGAGLHFAMCEVYGRAANRAQDVG